MESFRAITWKRDLAPMHCIYETPLPLGWNEKPLGALITMKRGCSWSKDDEREQASEDTIPVIRIPNVQKSLDLNNLLHLQGVTKEQREASAVARGWTLMVGSNGNPKRIGDSVFMEEDQEMVFASFLLALRPLLDRNGIIDEFLACWLQSHRVHEFISETSQMTTGLANISWSACRKLPVRFPENRSEQARIVETLKAADDHIRAIEDQICKAERVKKASIRELFTKGWKKRGQREFKKTEIGTIPSDWVVAPLARICGGPDCVKTGPFGAPYFPHPSEVLSRQFILNPTKNKNTVTY
jgi:type I restriction enzyme, S subunit